MAPKYTYIKAGCGVATSRKHCCHTNGGPAHAPNACVEVPISQYGRCKRALQTHEFPLQIDWQEQDMRCGHCLAIEMERAWPAVKALLFIRAPIRRLAMLMDLGG